MKILSPEWLLIIPVCLLLGLAIKRLSLFRPLRVLAIILLGLILSKPEVNVEDNHLDLWVLFDRSESTQDIVEQGVSEWKQILESSKASRNDKIIYVNYAADVEVQEENTERANFSGNRKLTSTKLALEDILARRRENTPSRIVIFTDGYSTEPLHEVANKLSSQGIPVDFRLIRDLNFSDFQISKITLPTQSQVGEPFTLSVHVQGVQDSKVPLIVYRNGQKLSEIEVEVKNGEGKVEFSTRIPQAGSYRYSAKISPKNDTHEGNNHAEKWIQITGGPRVILVSNYDNDPLLEVLKRQEYYVDFIRDSESLNIGQLAGAKSVIFNNVPAHEVPNEFLNALDFYVNEQGGGFMMIGGDRSFAKGGFYNSPIDPLLPVSMEQKEDHRKLAVALSIVMDRSGSMGSVVNGGLSKMQLANNGAAEAIKLLGRKDQVAVYAVDSKPTTVVALQTIKGNQGSLVRKTKKIQSSGGGIYVYAGLKQAWKDLKKSELNTKHIILFSDASDTENPDKYVQLLEEMRRAKATVSVIGLGSKSDSDGALLEDIAQRGDGRVFFSENALDIPKFFSQETVAIARSAFIGDPTKTLETGNWQSLAQKPIDWLPVVDGYNLSYARENADVSLLSQDEFVAPLIAHWRKGLGRVAAITFPLAGKYSASAREWKQYGDMTQTVVNWLNGDHFPSGLTVRHKMRGTQLVIDLLYDTSADGYNWTREFAEHPPKIVLNSEGLVEDLAWNRIAPGHFSLSKDLKEGSLVKGAIQAGDYAIPFGPLIVDLNTEWLFKPERLNDLKALSVQTNGRELIDISKAWLRPEIVKSKSLIIYGSILLLIIILLDALFTRIGYVFKPSHLKIKGVKSNEEGENVNILHRKKAQKNASPIKNKSHEKLQKVSSVKKDNKTSRNERFSKAKRRK